MQEAKLLEVKINTINYSNNIAIPAGCSDTNIKIKTNISSTVNYDIENKKCQCITTTNFIPELDSVDFNVSISVVGIFECTDLSDRKKTHVEVCKKLFPYVQTTITSFMTLVGFPNFMVEEPQIDTEKITINS